MRPHRAHPMYDPKRVVPRAARVYRDRDLMGLAIPALQRVAGSLLLCFATNHRLRRYGDEMNVPSSIGHHKDKVLAAQNFYVTSGGPEAIGLYRVPAHERRIKPSGAQVDGSL